jgi:hypothetical protein
MRQEAPARFSGMIERRKTHRKDWAIAKDEVGRAVLQWKVDGYRAARGTVDPCARTYDFLERLEVPDLALEDDVPASTRGPGCNPCDRNPPMPRKGPRSDQ